MTRSHPEILPVKTCVTCVKFFNGHLLAGIGGLLHVITPADSKDDPWKRSACVPVFDSQSIHGILPKDETSLLVFGGKKVAILTFGDLDTSINSFEVVSGWTASDWILDAVCCPNGDVVFLTANNALLRFSSTSGRYEEASKKTCSERSILYSGKILNFDWKNLIVLAGTVFSEIVVWANRFDSPSPVLHRLKGHQGVIFSVDYNEALSMICSTSDDRTVRLWTVDSHDWENSKISLNVTMFGHSARVWKSCFLPGGRIASIGEDSLICIWTTLGDLEIQRSGHEGGEIRCLDFNLKMNAIATGGSDGGINLWPATSPASPCQLPAVPSKGWLPKCTACLSDGHIVVISNDGGFSRFSNGQWQSCFTDSTFKSYCLFATSPDNNHLAMASIDGWIQIVRARDSVSLRGKFRVATCRIYAISWVSNETLVANIEEGRLLLLKFWEDSCQTLNEFVLPLSRDRWITCGALKGDFLLFGDRCGSLHLYSKRQIDPLDTLRKIHGFKGVSDAKFLRGGIIMSTGRDGTYKRYVIANDKLRVLSSFKMNIHWPSAIVELDTSVVILGFHETHLYVWSVEERCTLFKIDCGGGHRSWSCLISNDFALTYIKDKSVYYFRCPLRDISVRALTTGFSSATINTACVLPSDIGVYVLFAAEDGTLRPHLIDCSSRLVSLGVARSHISSVRAVACLKMSSTRVFAVSAGGRGQLIVWEVIERESFALVELVSHFIRPNFDASKMSEPLDEPEMRYMDLSCFETHSGRLAILGACSDGNLRLFNYEKDNSLKLTNTVEFPGCLLKTLHFQISDEDYALSASTTGQIHITTVDFENQVSFSWLTLGINACDCWVDESEQRVIVATGSDDACICLRAIELRSGKFQLCADSWTSFSPHSCQITGIRLFKDKLVSCSLDQKIAVFAWSHRNISLVSQISCRMSYIPDCHGLLAWYSFPKHLKILVFGEGIQLWKISGDEKTVGDIRPMTFPH